MKRLLFSFLILTFFDCFLCQQCNIEGDCKIDCHPENGASEAECSRRGCCWKEQNRNLKNAVFGEPSCFFPENYEGYRLESIREHEFKTDIRLRRNIPSGLPREVNRVNVELIYVSNSIARIRVTDHYHKRWEPKLPKLNIPKRDTSFLYSIEWNSSLVVSVVSKNTGTPVFSTDLRRLIFSNQFIQLASSLPSKYVYGIGEHKAAFRKEADWKLYTLYNHDTGPVANTALYGSHPFYLTLEDNSEKSSGVFLFNSNAMDIGLTPSPSIVYRTIGGILDFFVFVGDSPSSVVSDYIKLIGLPAMPPMWGLGFHLCRWGYNNLENTIAAWNRTRNAKIPFDVQWNDIDYMHNYNDFTYDNVSYNGLQEFVQHIHHIGMHYVIITDPGVSAGEIPGTYPPYDEGVEMNIFIKNHTDQILIGRVWNRSGKTVFPDFTDPNSLNYWLKQIKRFHSEISFDGMWLDMNEISNFVDGSLYGCPKLDIESPPYLPGNITLQKNTLCMSANHYEGLHYNIHNLYSLYETMVTNSALRKLRHNKRPFIISRSTFAGHGKYGGHWSGDIWSDYDDMRWTVPWMMNFNMFGVPLVGSDICGFGGNTTVEMCARWMALGAFYPFSRNHNSNGNSDQDPASLGPIVASASRNALSIRYHLLPYLYTLFYRGHKFGETVIRPLFFEFPNDDISRSIETQFLWGSGLMIAPVLEQNVRELEVYLPGGRWYYYSDYRPIDSIGAYKRCYAPINQINLFIRGGVIIPMADYALDITQTNQLYDRNTSFNLIVALDENNQAKGDLFWDDGDSLDSIDQRKYNYVTFEATDNTISIISHAYGYRVHKELNTVFVLGVYEKPNIVTVNGLKNIFIYSASVNVLWIPIENQFVFEECSIQWN